MKKIKAFFRTISLKNSLLATAGSIILAFGLYNIHSVSGVTEGGTLGLSLLFEQHFDISPSLTEFILNSVCYIIGIRVLGKNFIIYSVISTASFSISYGILECFPVIYPPLADYPLTAALLGAVFVGTGAGLAVRAGGAPCGDDALAMSIAAKTSVKIQWVYLISDVSVLLLSLTYIPLKEIVYSLLTVILSGQIIGLISGEKTKDKKRKTA